MTLTDFLLARIAEDEEVARLPQGYEYCGPLSYTHTPDRVLAECEAKLRIVETLAHDYRWNRKRAGDNAKMTLELLALPYADHPDYRQEWKP